jgi:excisionase family DNA binding protein
MRYVTLQEVGQVLERHTETVLEWLAQGRLPALQIQGSWLVPRAALWPFTRVSESDD